MSYRAERLVRRCCQLPDLNSASIAEGGMIQQRETLAGSLAVFALFAASLGHSFGQTASGQNSAAPENQSTLEAILPDAPSALVSTDLPFSTSKSQPGEADRISALDPTDRFLLAHPTPDQRWDSFLQHSFARSALRGDLLDAALAQFHNEWPEYGKGSLGFERRFGAVVAGHVASNFFGTYLFPTLLHQNQRSPRLGPEHTVWRRFGYALSRVAVTRDDYGKEAVNSSLLLSSVAANTITNLYYPRNQRGFSTTLSRIEGSLIGNVQGNLSREFLPDIEQFLWKHAPGGLQRLAQRLPLSKRPQPAGLSETSRKRGLENDER
jgi:hypothetical protein